MFKEERGKSRFRWEDMGNIEEGRSNLGPSAPVWAYRLLQYTFRDVLITRLGPEKANEILIEAGKTAGMQFFKNMLKPGSALMISWQIFSGPFGKISLEFSGLKKPTWKICALPLLLPKTWTAPACLLPMRWSASMMKAL
jgi:hypothetical protein